jgi:hypothetical protein
MKYKKALTPFLLFFLAVIVYGGFGFEGKLLRDDAMFIYGGQRLVDGAVPYVGMFDVKGPIAPMAAGIGVAISRWMEWDDVLGARLVFLFASALAVVGAYFLGSSLFRCRKTGVLSAMAFLGFFDFAREAASGPRAKSLVVLFGIFSLYFAGRKKWFWGGFFGALSALTWQPTGIFLLASFIMALMQPGKERLRAASLSAVGIGLPAAALVLYFYSQGALFELLDGILLFHLNYLVPVNVPAIYHILLPYWAVTRGYTLMALPIAIGLIVIMYLHYSRRALHGSFKGMLRDDPFAPVFLSFFPFVAWSALDFQGPADFYVFLPYVAVGFAHFLAILAAHMETRLETGRFAWAGGLVVPAICLALTVAAAADIRHRSESGYLDQVATADAIEQRFGEDLKLLSIGCPEALVVMGRTNPNPYPVLIGGMDRRIHATTLGGFEGWLMELAFYDADVIAFGPTGGPHERRLMQWIESRYHEEKMGPWKLYIRDTGNT